jgi:hypothetical protein
VNDTMRVRGVTLNICWFSQLKVYRENVLVLCVISIFLFMFYKEFVCAFLHCKGLKPTHPPVFLLLCILQYFSLFDSLIKLFFSIIFSLQYCICVLFAIVHILLICSQSNLDQKVLYQLPTLE